MQYVYALIVSGCAASQHFLVLPDSLCTNGIVDFTATACCPKNCGSCDDHNPACHGNGDLNKAKGPQCCPTLVSKNERSCDKTHPPCVLSEAYAKHRGNPLSIFNSTHISDNVAHAQEDCNTAQEDTQDITRVAVHYVRQEGVSFSATQGECGTMISVARGCLGDSKCLGFSLKTNAEEDKACKLTGELGESTDSAETETFIKVKDISGRNVQRGIDAVAGKHEVSGNATTQATSKTVFLEWPVATAADLLKKCKNVHIK